MTPRDVIDPSWVLKLGNGPLTWGLDLATSEKKTANPSSLVFNEKISGMEIERLVIAWKTDNPDVTEAILGVALNDVKACGRKCKNGNIDGSNERFFAQRLKKRFQSHCPIRIIAGNEKVAHGVEEFDAKTLLGNLYVNAYTDGIIAVPAGPWIKDDRRLVKRDKGRFDCDLGRMGEHGDTFDAGKLAHWGQVGRGGPVQAEAVRISDSGISPQERDRLQGISLWAEPGSNITINL